MFYAEKCDIEKILRDYHIQDCIERISELQRYHYERDDPNSREVRLIIRIDFQSAPSLVMRFKNEKDVSRELIESQSHFANVLKKNKIITPEQFHSNGQYANWYTIGGYDVIVTIEEFVPGEIKIVDEVIAEKTGALLANTHSIAEQNDLHVENDVLFDPFRHNDLFAFDAFLTLGQDLEGEAKILFEQIVGRFDSYMQILEPLRNYPKYAVQGDISDCNLYLTDNGEVGIFDYNRCGDNSLFCDAIMQAVFESRLMDYPETGDENYAEGILHAFLKGYCSVRGFTEDEKKWYPYLYAIINAFWSADIRWNENSLLNAHKAGDSEAVLRWLNTIWSRLDLGRSSIDIF